MAYIKVDNQVALPIATNSNDTKSATYIDWEGVGGSKENALMKRIAKNAYR